jgi:hypothetical protein
VVNLRAAICFSISGRRVEIFSQTLVYPIEPFQPYKTLASCNCLLRFNTRVAAQLVGWGGGYSWGTAGFLALGDFTDNNKKTYRFKVYVARMPPCTDLTTHPEGRVLARLLKTNPRQLCYRPITSVRTCPSSTNINIQILYIHTT